MSSLKLSLTAVIFLALLGSPADGKAKRKRVEAVKGKQYLLRKEHDPWMIMVTSLRNVDPQLRTEGMSAPEAANSIVYELRRKGIPAYVYHQREELDETGSYKAKQEYIAVLAGGFDSPDHKWVKPVLEYIQDFQPEFLKNGDSGAVRRPGQAEPFRTAFVAPNPLRPKSDRGVDDIDPLIRKLNSGSGELSLLKNRGKFTLKVASFSGGKVVQVSGQTPGKSMAQFNEKFGTGVGQAGVSAWELATALRQARRLGYEHDYEAWVYHDRHRSIVTIGSFDSPDDPRLRMLQDDFQAKDKTDPATGHVKLTPELFSIPKNPVGRSLPDKLWFFDSNPRIVAVPGR